MAIIGAGTIGPDIGYYLKSALPESRLYLIDVAEQALRNAEVRFSGHAKKAVDRKKMTTDQAQAMLDNIVYTTDYDQIRNCDLVIESATENIPLKQKIFQAIEERVDKDTIITSNTSAIPADRLYLKLKHPERMTVTHFFAPAYANPIVEVINWSGVSRDVLDFLRWFFAYTGKVPVVTDNVIGFMLDRIFDNWCNEAAYLLNQASAAQICRVTEEFALQGPFYVVNLGNGNPIVVETCAMFMEEGDHYRPAPILSSVERWAVPRPGTEVDVPEDIRKAVRDRMLGLLFSQSFDIADRVIGTKEDLNLGCQIGLGFRKGPFDIMQDIGEQEVNRIMENFQEYRPGFPMATKAFSFYQDFKRFVIVDEVDGVKIITIRRPQALNAINDDINSEILSVLKEGADNPSVKGFVITGYGNTAFSAGTDIGRFPETLGNGGAAEKLARDCAVLVLFIDQMKKPIVAAVNGMALGGGLEVAIRCHSIVAKRDAVFQLPEVTLGIIPGNGGCVIPYRKWPQGAEVFHDMVCLARRLNATEGARIGMVKKVVDGYDELIREAVEEVKSLQGKVGKIPDAVVSIPEIRIPDQPMAGKLPLSKEAISIIARTIKDAAAVGSLKDALEINYRGVAEIACTDAAREGISAFLEKRKPEFRK
jgi:enoyl-CoA hydratase/3-hydroxyacyl-CoA dehydrogenase